MRCSTPSRAVRISTGSATPRCAPAAQPDHAVGAGQAEVEHQRVVRRVAGQRRVGRRAVAKPVDHVAELAQAGGQRVAELGVVFENQQAH